MPTFRKLLATTDFSRQSEAGVAYAASLARRLDAVVVLLYVVEDELPPLLIGVSEDRRRSILEEHRGEAADRLLAYATEHMRGVAVRPQVRVGPPARRIVEVAGEEQVDLIVMASRGYGPLGQVLLGSTAERVLHHAPCPVLVVRDGRE
jgi:nucleotide-binding universal stress UspA family protein